MDSGSKPGGPETQPRPEITLLTRIGELLDHYPDLERVLVDLAPAFAKLRNPVLRKTVAKVATVQKAASIAGLDPGEMLATLRRAAGLSVGPADGTEDGLTDGDGHVWPEPPPGMSGQVSETVDADELLAAGEVPIGRVVKAAGTLEGGRVLRVTSTFRPVPLLEALQKQGFDLFLRENGPEAFETFVRRSSQGRSVDFTRTLL